MNTVPVSSPSPKINPIQTPPVVSIMASFAPGGTVVYCPHGVAQIDGHFTKNPVQMFVTITCLGEKKRYSLIVK